MTARPTRMIYQTKEIGRVRGDRCDGTRPISASKAQCRICRFFSARCRRLWQVLAYKQTRDSTVPVTSFLYWNPSCLMWALPWDSILPQHEQCIRFLLPSSSMGRLSPLSHVCTFVPFCKAACSYLAILFP